MKASTGMTFDKAVAEARDCLDREDQGNAMAQTAVADLVAREELWKRAGLNPVAVVTEAYVA
jgi:hypothetical protein